ncbi:hypothetical protein NPIL_506561 [Nephila pilipes]|uniref:Uncharacterized protein n=1 Tax=Nephila pilipes TaxID=299642 RepID=A0A8X6QAZ6_NEPPI|nr:hypothetical protein NPIL_506561 [Nephila pilipes]
MNGYSLKRLRSCQVVKQNDGPWESLRRVGPGAQNPEAPLFVVVDDRFTRLMTRWTDTRAMGRPFFHHLGSRAMDRADRMINALSDFDESSPTH